MSSTLCNLVRFGECFCLHLHSRKAIHAEQWYRLTGRREFKSQPSTLRAIRPLLYRSTQGIFELTIFPLPDIPCNVINSSRLRWAGHVARMKENELPKKILCTNPGGQRERGRPKSRWIDGVEEDTRKLGCRNWLTAVQDKSRWRHLLE